MSVSRYIDDRLTIVVFTNRGGDADPADPHEIAKRVAAIYIPDVAGNLKQQETP
jgi:hypothetical protein